MTDWKYLCVVVAVVLSASSSAQQPQSPEALDGVDTVLLLKTGKETFGTSAFKSSHGGLTYLFASAETKAAFDAAPQKYAVQMDGQCARMRGGVRGNPSNYAVVDGKIYVFGSDDCRSKFLAAPAKFIPRDPPAMPSSPDAIAAGKALLARTVAAHGGKTLESLTAYAEAHKTAQPAGRQGPPQELRWMWAFPGGARSERTFTMGGPTPRTATVATIVSGGKAWSGLVDGDMPLRPIHPAGLGDIEQLVGWQLMPLLRSREGSGTTVASLGTATVEGVSVERVRVKRGAVDVTVNIDPATNRAHSLSFVGRNRDGEYGEVTVLFSDYREVSGVLVPFVEKGLFDGAPDESWTRTLEKVEINPALDASLFRPPAAGMSR